MSDLNMVAYLRPVSDHTDDEVEVPYVPATETIHVNFIFNAEQYEHETRLLSCMPEIAPDAIDGMYAVLEYLSDQRLGSAASAEVSVRSDMLRQFVSILRNPPDSAIAYELCLFLRSFVTDLLYQVRDYARDERKPVGMSVLFNEGEQVIDFQLNLRSLFPEQEAKMILPRFRSGSSNYARPRAAHVDYVQIHELSFKVAYEHWLNTWRTTLAAGDKVWLYDADAPERQMVWEVQAIGQSSTGSSNMNDIVMLRSEVTGWSGIATRRGFLYPLEHLEEGSYVRVAKKG